MPGTEVRLETANTEPFRKRSATGKNRTPSIAVLLSSREKFGPYYGGALARWTYEVYSRTREQLDVTVFGFPTQSEDLYPLHHETSAIWRTCEWMGRVPGARRYEERVWLYALVRRLRCFDAIHIHNRPQWVRALRQMGYHGAILLHLQNDHLGHWTPAMLDALAPDLDAVIVCSSYLRDTFAHIDQSTRQARTTAPKCFAGWS